MTQLSGARVFIVDDERVIATSLAVILENSGFSTRAFTNPLDVLACAQSDPPDLLISDVMMPEMTGLDLAIQIKSLCPGCKILLFSGQAQTAGLLKAARDEGHDFAWLTKPVHPTDLLLGIRGLVSR